MGQQTHIITNLKFVINRRMERNSETFFEVQTEGAAQECMDLMNDSYDYGNLKSSKIC